MCAHVNIGNSNSWYVQFHVRAHAASERPCEPFGTIFAGKAAALRLASCVLRLAFCVARPFRSAVGETTVRRCVTRRGMATIESTRSVHFSTPYRLGLPAIALVSLVLLVDVCFENWDAALVPANAPSTLSSREIASTRLTANRPNTLVTRRPVGSIGTSHRPSHRLTTALGRQTTWFAK